MAELMVENRYAPHAHFRRESLNHPTKKIKKKPSHAFL